MSNILKLLTTLVLLLLFIDISPAQSLLNIEKIEFPRNAKDYPFKKSNHDNKNETTQYLTERAIAKQKALEAKYNVKFGERLTVDLSKASENYMEQGIILVKFSPEVADLIGSTLIKQKSNDYVKISSTKIDALNQEFKVSQYKSALHDLYVLSPEEQKFKERHKAWGFSQWYEITIDNSVDILEAVEAFSALENVELAEPVYKKKLIEPVEGDFNDEKSTVDTKAGWTPDDPYYSKQWGYSQIEMPEAWEIAKGNSKVLVGIFDGGMQYDHPDLEANVWSGIGPDGTNTSPIDHATHVGGTVAAVNNNGVGVAGCAGGDGTDDSGVELMTLNIIYGDISVYEAFVYAADNGVAIAQNSWGYDEAGVYNSEDLDGIDYFNANGGGDVLEGGITIFAAGNDASEGSWYPGCYSEVIGVAATNSSDVLASFSNYGTWVDICAPGVNIYSCYSNDSYGNMSGTSMACPHVSGVAALALSYAPGALTNDELWNILIENTDSIDDLNSNYSGKIGSGRLNARKVMEELELLIEDIPEASFETNYDTIIVGGNVVFTDTSTNLPYSWEWTFENGFPETSISKKPTVTWLETGTFDVQLIATNVLGSDTLTLEDYITVEDKELPTENPVQIGTLASGTSGYPLGMSDSYGCSAAIYLSDEIGGSGSIDTLAWYTTVSRFERPITIYMKQTSDSVFSADLWANVISDATEVFSGTISNNAEEWTKVLLDIPYSYNGMSNLMVMVVVNDDSQLRSSGCKYETTTGYSRHMQWTGTNSGVSSDYGESNENRPWIQLSFAGYLPVTADFYGYDTQSKETFEEENIFPPENWRSIDNDGDGYNWFQVYTESWPESSDGDLGYAASYSYYNDTARTPDNWLISDTIILIQGEEYSLTWEVGTLDESYAEEEYSVLISSSDTQVSSFISLFNETLPEGTDEWLDRNLDISDYNGDTIFIAFRHHGSTGMYALLIDNIAVSKKSYSEISIYEGEKAVIYDESTNGPVAWKWSTPDGTPETHSTQDVEVLYYTEGSYDVTLVTGNSDGISTETKNNFVNVTGRLPKADFSSEKGNLMNFNSFGPFIPVGGLVDFTDESSRIPTAWLWNFSGTEQSTSTEQSPSDIAYYTPGVFDVKLIASNEHGNNTILHDDYIVVGGPDTATNFLSSDTYTVYGSDVNSYYTGHNSYGFSKFAELYKNNYGGEVSKIYVDVFTAVGNEKYVTFYVWENNSGTPGNVLGSKEVLISSLTAESWNTIEFDNPVSVSGDFFVGYIISYDTDHDYTSHNFSIYQAKTRNDGACTAYTYYNGGWYSYNDLFSGLFLTSLALNPEFTYDCSVPELTDTIYGDLNVESNSTVTYYVDELGGVNYEWTLPETWSGSSTSDSITVAVGTSGGIISVTPSNSCGIGDTITLMVTVDDEDIFTIIASSGENGSVNPSGDIKVLEGWSQTFEFTPETGYEIDKVLVDNREVDITDNRYIFTEVNSNHTIIVNYSEIGTGINDHTLNDINLYPNPSNSQVNISGILGCKIEIYNVLGSVVYMNREVSSTTLTIDVNNYEKGLYFVKIQKDNSIWVLKVLIE